MSETFMYHQVKSLSDKYDVHLIARKFANPHGYDLDSFDKTVVKSPANFLDRVAGKLIRMYYKSDLNIGLQTYSQLRKLLKEGNCKAIHAHFGPKALEILGFAKKFGVPLVVTFHGYDASQMLRDETYANRLPELFDYASAIIIVSGHMRETMNLEQWKDKVFLIPCSVDPAQFSVNGEHKPSDTINILHSGRLVGQNGVPDIIRVFGDLSRKYNNITLHIAGDGRELERCRQLANEFNIDDIVTFYGSVPHSKVRELLGNADIFVLNSRVDEKGDMEGTPVSILEAMCMEKAVVSTRHAGIPYVIEDGKNGLLADEYANDQLKQQIEKLIRSRSLRKKLGEEAGKTVRNSFSTDVMRDKLQEVFDSIEGTLPS
ncbi:MAG: glycosyltransferase family 4 protein [Balneolaceae bacterium]|nr:glycosyltransferase family 4 protein [Balneolaceae bacterium]